MMKKLITTMMLLAIVAGANAAMSFVVWDDASGGWREYADSTLTITPSTIIIVGLQDDGSSPTGLYALGIEDGPGELYDQINVLQSGVTAVLMDDAVTAESYGLQNPYIALTLDASIDGVVASNEFHCTGEGDVTLTVYNSDGTLADTLVIHQIPEPATLALLGLGGLLLRKRRSA